MGGIVRIVDEAGRRSIVVDQMEVPVLVVVGVVRRVHHRRVGKPGLFERIRHALHDAKTCCVGHLVRELPHHPELYPSSTSVVEGNSRVLFVVSDSSSKGIGRFVRFLFPHGFPAVTRQQLAHCLVAVGADLERLACLLFVESLPD